jgi:hypothetical protein
MYDQELTPFGEKPGMRTLTAAQYQADPCPQPSMAAHDAEVLVHQSPRHCWHQHPRLNPCYGISAGTRPQQQGSALHDLFFNKGLRIDWIDGGEAWRTDDAKKARHDSLLASRIPVLKSHSDRLHRACVEINDSLLSHKDLAPLLDPQECVTQAPMIWQDGPTLCRAWIDVMPFDPAAPLLDIRFTDRIAADYERLVQRELGVRAVHDLRGSQQTRHISPAGYWYVIAEARDPFGVKVFRVGQSILDGVMPLWTEARDLFGACLAGGDRRDFWPSYPPMVQPVEVAGQWQRDQWAAQAAQLHLLRDASIHHAATWPL